MGFRDILKDKKVILSDKDIAADMLKDSKFGLIGLTFAHHALTDLAMKKDWYPVNAAPLDQIRIDLVDSEHALS